MDKNHITIIDDGVTYNKKLEETITSKEPVYVYSLEPQEGFSKAREIKFKYTTPDKKEHFVQMITTAFKDENGDEKEKIISIYKVKENTLTNHQKLKQTHATIENLLDLKKRFNSLEPHFDNLVEYYDEEFSSSSSTKKADRTPQSHQEPSKNVLQKILDKAKSYLAKFQEIKNQKVFTTNEMAQSIPQISKKVTNMKLKFKEKKPAAGLDNILSQLERLPCIMPKSA